jgi:hypothetical protein
VALPGHALRHYFFHWVFVFFPSSAFDSAFGFVCEVPADDFLEGLTGLDAQCGRFDRRAGAA